MFYFHPAARKIMLNGRTIENPACKQAHFAQNKTNKRVILLFIDGLGLGDPDPLINPLYRGNCPQLLNFLEQHASAIDACMGVPGLPQSATGQTALLTGINAAQIEGRHIAGFPGKRLKNLIRKHNIFRKFLACGQTATFANAYFTTDIELVRNFRRQSATTTATLSAFDTVRDSSFLNAGEAVYHDLTRAGLRCRGYNGPLIAPSQAAVDLLRIARQNNFTLFEYFQTDRAGHKNDASLAKSVLSELNEFVRVLVEQAPKEGMTFALTGDHGNIEDCRIRTHTANRIPFAAIGPGSDEISARIKSITDVSPAILRYCAAQ